MLYTTLNPAKVAIQADLLETIDLARICGFAGIDVWVSRLAGGAAEARAAIEAAGLRAGGCGLEVDFRGDCDRYERTLAGLEHFAATAAEAGLTRCTTWLMPCHDELDYQANFDLHAQRLGPIAAALAKYAIRFGIEFVGPATLRQSKRYPFVHTIDQCLELADAIGSDTGILLDSFHWYTSGATAEDIIAKLPGRIVYVDVNDAPGGSSIAEQLDNDRRLPGTTGVIDLAGFIAALRQINYDGPVAAEPFYPPLGELPAVEAAHRVARSLRRALRSYEL